MDATYGKLLARQKIWGEKDEAGNVKKTYFKDLETEPCQKKDFRLKNGGSSSGKFYAPDADYEDDLDRIFNKL